MKKEEVQMPVSMVNKQHTAEQKELIRKASAYYMQKNEALYKRLADR